MEYANVNKQFYCGIDLHARNLFACVMDKKGEILYHRNMENDFNRLTKRLKPYLHDIAIGVESTFNWYWLADGCHNAGIPFYLGHALYMKAIHGGKKKNDRIDSKTIADLLRCNLFPLAYPYPKEMRSTRDLLRRRHRYVAIRAESYSHIQNTFSQQGIIWVRHNDVKRKNSRRELINKLDHKDITMSIECDLDMMEAMDIIIYKIEKQVYAQAKQHDRNAFNILMTVPGLGKMLALTILYEIHTIERFRSAQDFSSYCRLVKVERTSNGKNTGQGNNKIGNPTLKWAFTDIIIHAQINSDPIKRYYEKLKSKHGIGKAKSIIAHKFAIAVYYMLNPSSTKLPPKTAKKGFLKQI
jgi:transposase